MKPGASVAVCFFLWLPGGGRSLLSLLFLRINDCYSFFKNCPKNPPPGHLKIDYSCYYGEKWPFPFQILGGDKGVSDWTEEGRQESREQNLGGRASYKPPSGSGEEAIYWGIGSRGGERY